MTDFIISKLALAHADDNMPERLAMRILTLRFGHPPLEVQRWLISARQRPAEGYGEKVNHPPRMWG